MDVLGYISLQQNQTQSAEERRDDIFNESSTCLTDNFLFLLKWNRGSRQVNEFGFEITKSTSPLFRTGNDLV